MSEKLNKRQILTLIDLNNIMLEIVLDVKLVIICQEMI